MPTQGNPLAALLVVVFGFFFVTVASRIVGLIGSSSSPVSGMTIATLILTCTIFVAIGWTGDVYAPIALTVGAVVCIAAANAGATSQDLKTGFLVGATPRHQQVGLVIGVIVSSLIIGVTTLYLHKVMVIGSNALPAPQATLMSTIIRGLLSQNLPWGLVLAGVFIAVTMELCGVRSLSFAVGAYLPIATTAPIFVGGVVRWLVERATGKPEESEVSAGTLFSSGLIAGGSIAGIAYAVLYGSRPHPRRRGCARLSAVPARRASGHIVGLAVFLVLGVISGGSDAGASTEEPRRRRSHVGPPRRPGPRRRPAGGWRRRPGGADRPSRVGPQGDHPGCPRPLPASTTCSRSGSAARRTDQVGCPARSEGTRLWLVGDAGKLPDRGDDAR